MVGPSVVAGLTIVGMLVYMAGAWLVRLTVGPCLAWRLSHWWAGQCPSMAGVVVRSPRHGVVPLVGGLDPKLPGCFLKLSLSPDLRNVSQSIQK